MYSYQDLIDRIDELEGIEQAQDQRIQEYINQIDILTDLIDEMVMKLGANKDE